MNLLAIEEERIYDEWCGDNILECDEYNSDDYQEESNDWELDRDSGWNSRARGCHCPQPHSNPYFCDDNWSQREHDSWESLRDKD
jgi:hypothetical protein